MGTLFKRSLSRWRGLSAVQKTVVCIAVVCATLWGGSKNGGLRSARLADPVSTASLRTGETATLRALPDDLVENTNALRITAFSIDPQNCELAFEVAWASNLFDAADSRNLHLFSATNLNARQWAPLGAFAMPLGTNACAFAVTSNEVDAAWRPRFLASFAHAGFYSLGIDFDADGDGLADVYERFWTLTDPANADTDGDGLSDGEELSADVATDPLLYDTDGDGLPDGWESAHGLDPASAAVGDGADGDPDGDGLLNIDEYLNALSPISETRSLPSSGGL